MPCLRVLPESIRWLASKGRTTEALNIVRRAAHLNRIPADQLNIDEMKLAAINEVGHFYTHIYNTLM